MTEQPFDNRFTNPEYIQKLLKENRTNDELRTPARIFSVDREKGIITIDKKAFEQFDKTPIGQHYRHRMTKFELDHFDYWMYLLKLHRKQKIKFVVEFIDYLQGRVEKEKDENGKLSNFGHIYEAKIMEIKHSFRFRLFWYNLYLNLKPNVHSTKK